MRKWLARLGSGITLLLIILILSCYYLLGTKSGAVFLVTQAQKQLDGNLAIGATQGRILDRLELDDILFTSPATGEIRIKHLILDWKSSDLLNFNLRIIEFAASGVSYAPPKPNESQQDPKSNTTIVLPDLNLPFNIEIEKLTITDFSLLSDKDTPPLLVNSAALSLKWTKTGINIQQLQVQMEEGILTLSGNIIPRDSYVTTLSSSLLSTVPDLPRLEMQGSYKGDIRELTIQQSITGAMAADLQITLRDILGELGWDINLNIGRLNPALFATGLAGILEGRMVGSGSLHRATATANMAIRSKDDPLLNWDAELNLAADLDSLAFTINQLSLRRPETTTQLDLSGTASLHESFDLNLHWTDIQWPITGPAQYASSAGRVRLNGQIDDYRLEFYDSYFSGSMLPEGQLVLSSNGSKKGASNLILRAKLLNGETTLQGDIQWAPFFSWQLVNTATDIDPGEKYHDWPGHLQWKIKSSGSLKEEQLSTELEIESLRGSLRELPLTGSGKLSLLEKNILIDSLSLSSAASTLTANGSLGDASSLDWKLNILNFADLLPGASGTVQAKGTIQGMMEEPRLALHLNASGLRFQDLALDKLTTDANIDLSWQQDFSVKLHGSDLSSGVNLIQNLELLGHGTREAHTVDLQLTHELAAISLVLEGGYQHETWLGLLKQLNVHSQDLGNWQVQQPTKLQASSNSASLQEMCLGRENSALCLAGSWDAKTNDSSGNLTIKSIPLQWLSPWLPKPVEEIGGLFSASASAKMGATLQADVTAAITPGVIKYKTVQKTGSVSHQGMKLDLNILNNGLDANLSLAIDSNRIQAVMHSPDIMQIASKGDALVTGDIKMKADTFDLVEVLVPAVQNLDAAIDIDLAVTGTIKDPKVKGAGTITIPYVFIPSAGLELKESSLELQGTETELRLKGRLNSPGGNMALDGWVTLDSSQNFPLQLKVKSDNFRVINLPEMRIFLSSDLLLKREPELTSLLGDLTIPRAEILLRQLPKGSQSISPDVVILQEKDEEQATTPLHMDIKATLGQNVHFSGLGLNAFINGQLSILAEPGEQIMGSGSFSIDQGSFRAYGQDLDIETGIISFPGGPLTQPGINLRATRTIGDVVAGIYAIGPARKPRITTFSKPPMSESHIISYLLTGSSPSEAGKGTKLSVGRQINNKLSVSMGTDVKTGDSEFVTRYRLNRNIHIQTTTAGEGNAADIFYSVELGGAKQKDEREQGGSSTPPE